jgi:hypothetical protein
MRDSVLIDRCPVLDPQGQQLAVLGPVDVVDAAATGEAARLAISAAPRIVEVVRPTGCRRRSDGGE